MLVAGIALVLLKANATNAIVSDVHDAAGGCAATDPKRVGLRGWQYSPQARSSSA
jgi:hypothetical protein